MVIHFPSNSGIIIPRNRLMHAPWRGRVIDDKKVLLKAEWEISKGEKRSEMATDAVNQGEGSKHQGDSGEAEVRER
ncbi:hypothetical protein Nepgr_012003 [Nepenthes gracilis]|uniref:Uncharacterized protein n=1 Tax=Nepenthes gracilis TaxID=150966 RepID=A0AAD3SFB4_NEPGR|nr:hypothetical protein Nepgr_012003 [Nepenthes gracilis]